MFGKPVLLLIYIILVSSRRQSGTRGERWQRHSKEDYDRRRKEVLPKRDDNVRRKKESSLKRHSEEERHKREDVQRKREVEERRAKEDFQRKEEEERRREDSLQSKKKKERRYEAGQLHSSSDLEDRQETFLRFMAGRGPKKRVRLQSEIKTFDDNYEEVAMELASGGENSPGDFNFL